LLGALLDQPELFSAEHAKHVEELLTSPELRGIFRAARALVVDGGRLDAPVLLAQVEGNAALNWLRERLSTQPCRDKAEAEEILNRGISLLAQDRIKRELPELANRIGEARRRGDESMAITLTKQRDELALSAHRLVKGPKR
jgi:replicative DNA helicase